MSETTTPGSAALLALADQIDRCAPVTPEGQAAILLNKRNWTMICDALRLAAKPDEDGVREAIQTAKKEMRSVIDYLHSDEDKHKARANSAADFIIDALALSTTGHPKP